MSFSFSLRIAALALLLVISLDVAANGRSPYVPDSATAVLQTIPSAQDPRVRAFETLRRKLAQHPDDLADALALARAYIDYGRSTGDARFLGRALAVIDPWTQKTPVPVPILLVHATILQSRHFFAAARTELKSLLRRDPNNAQAWLTLATVAMVQGDYALANRSCVKLAGTGGDFMGTACSASLRSLTGHADQAYRLLTLIENPGPKAPLAVKAWIEGLLADTAKRLGDWSEADRHFRKALQYTPGDNFLLADYADFLLDRGDATGAARLVRDYSQSDTSFLRLTFAESALDDARTAADIKAMAARFAAMDRRGTHVYRREQARFVLYLLHSPQRALKLAEENWKVQRAPKDVRIYLEAALAAGRPQAASPVLAFIDRHQLQDQRVRQLAEAVRAEITSISARSHMAAR